MCTCTAWFDNAELKIFALSGIVTKRDRENQLNDPMAEA